MPLTLYRRSKTGPWWIRGTVRGTRVRESTGIADEARADGYRIKREAELWDSSVHGRRATITFAEAVVSYLESEPRSAKTREYLAKLLDHFGPMRLTNIGQEHLDTAYRAILRPGAAAATKVRAVRTPLVAVLEHAARRKWCERPAFEAPRVARAQTTFLRPDEATALCHAAADHLRPLLRFLFGTGARLSEALELEWHAVDLRGARASLRQKQGTIRHASLPPVTVTALRTLQRHEGPVFLTNRGLPYADKGRLSGGQIGTGWAHAWRRAGLRPAARCGPHIARHSWASWDHCVHKDLIGLRERGGWETVAMCERYAHLMPDEYRADVLAWWGGELAERRVG
jgi:integrase